MKLAIFTHNYPSEQTPSAGIFIVDHTKHLTDSDPDLEARVHNFPFGEYPMTAAVKKPWKWPKFAWYFLSLPLRVRRAIQGSDAALAHWWLPAGIAAAMVKGRRPLTVICHGTDLYLFQKHLRLARSVSFLAGRVDRWQCVSQDLKRILLQLYPFIDESIIRVEPMPVAEGFSNLGLPRESDLIVSCGSMIGRKKFDDLIRVMNALEGVRLRIYGEGPQRPQLLGLVDELGLTDRVELPGNVSREELNRAFNTASLFVLLSVDEGYGMVLKEAQMAGCPTMAYASDGMVDTGLDYPIDPGADIPGAIRRVLRQSTE
ncbi:MAG: glycosyltransferase [bacterium]